MSKYSVEKNVQMLVALMKAHGIRKIVASPGMKNMPFIASVQFDDFFEVYSCVDERSAAYIACGLAVESGEPVALSCTGATASRNYVSGLTEAYYRHIPILAVTSMSYTGEVGHMIPQVIDRSSQMNDLVYKSVEIQIVNSEKDEWSVNTKINDALLALKRNNGGPVHINLIHENYTDFTDTLMKTRKIDRITYEDEMPRLEAKRIAVFVGSHKVWDPDLTAVVDEFCEKYNSVVICDKTSNYYGKYRINATLLHQQRFSRSALFDVDILIHLGDVSGSYISFNAGEIWRVDRDGEIRDTFKKLRFVFEMSESHFFRSYLLMKTECAGTDYYEAWKKACSDLIGEIPKLPFSNAWIAQQTEGRLPENSILQLGILNSLRNWNFFEVTKGVPCFSNVGGFGIDGMMSTAIGTAIGNGDKIVYLVLGDLSFFYDMNVLGNRHVPDNIRIILINNGMGIEFKNYGHKSAVFGDDADDYMAAAGHFGDKSGNLVKHYAEDLGLEYLCAGNKDEYMKILDMLLSEEKRNAPLLVECFTNERDESDALKLLSTFHQDVAGHMKKAVYNIVGEKGFNTIKRIIE